MIARGALCSAAILSLALNCASAEATAKRPFTVEDDIKLAQFGVFDNLQARDITWSPDGSLVVVHVERGSLITNKPEDEIRVYDRARLRQFVNSIGPRGADLAPMWSLKRSTYKSGAIISRMQWCKNSKCLAFLVKSGTGANQLYFSNFVGRPIRLSGEDQDILSFDVADRYHYVFSVRSPKRDLFLRESDAVFTVGTGHSLPDLLTAPREKPNSNLEGILWAARGGLPKPVIDRVSKKPLVLFREGETLLAISPDGSHVATSFPVSYIPAAWERRFRPPLPGSPIRIKAGAQDLASAEGNWVVERAAIVDLAMSTTQYLADAPTGMMAGWQGGFVTRAAWSSDGERVLFPSTFAVTGGGRLLHPCVTLYWVRTHRSECVEITRANMTASGMPEAGFYYITNLEFDGRDVSIQYLDQSEVVGYKLLGVGKQGDWVTLVKAEEPSNKMVSLHIVQSLSKPPVLEAETSSGRSRIVWNPNRYLDSVELTPVSVFNWQDASARRWTGGLYQPASFVKGHRYPLVIQTHGFLNNKFLPSGLMTTAFAARSLAAAGMFVLQVNDSTVNIMHPDEAVTQAAGYDSAVKALVEAGYVDPRSVGIVGFSRSVWYAMQSVVASNVHYKAASITDGVNVGYWQYLEDLDVYGSAAAHEADIINGGAPFGVGLKSWLARSPEFNLIKSNTPLMVVALGQESLLLMWEPYAIMRYLRKPVDLIVINDSQHQLSNPVSRLVSQGGTVDWFRFWLLNQEDPVPSKRLQYIRWRQLRNGK